MKIGNHLVRVCLYTSLAAERAHFLNFFLSALTPRRSAWDSARSSALFLRLAIAFRIVGVFFS